MSTKEEFEEIPHEIYKYSYQPRGHQRDKEALWNLNELYFNMGRTREPKTYGRGSWGYTGAWYFASSSCDRMFASRRTTETHLC